MLPTRKEAPEKPGPERLDSSRKLDSSTQSPYRFAQRMSHIGASAVREILKVTEQPDIISFAGGLPAAEFFPVDALARAHADVFAEEGAAALQYSTTEGWRPLREWIAARMQTQGVETAADRILITSGSQQGIDLAARVFLEAGDQVIVESPCYLAALQAFSAYEASFIPVGSDDEGMRVDEVERILETSQPKFIYLVANFQNPKGTSLSLTRRKQLVELAARSNVPIIEDDPYGEIRFSEEALPPLIALDSTGIVVYLSTFSKTLSPGLRIGWVVGAEQVIHALVIAKQAADLHTSTIAQRAAVRVHDYLDYDEHIACLRKVYSERCQTMLAAIERHFPAEVRSTRPGGGLFLWVDLPDYLSGSELLAEALEEKVAFVPGAPFFPQTAPQTAPQTPSQPENQPGRENHIRLNFSNSAPASIEEGIRRIGNLLKRRMR